MPDIPTGTVTLLFNDIEGSTRLWESDPAAMKTARERHDTLLRHCVAAHAGRRAESDAALKALVDEYAWTAACPIAEAHAARGEVDAAFAWLEKAYEQRDPGVTLAATDGLLAPLHDDPPWSPFPARLGLGVPAPRH